MIDIKLLEDGIKKIIEETLKDEKFKVSSEKKERKIKIYTGLLPPNPEETIIPAITIRTIKAKNTLEQKTLTTQISIGTYDENTGTGYDKICKVVQMVFDSLINIGVIEERFEILPEAEWYFPEQQPHPYYLAFINLNVVYEKDYRNDLENWVNGEE